MTHRRPVAIRLARLGVCSSLAAAAVLGWLFVEMHTRWFGLYDVDPVDSLGWDAVQIGWWGFRSFEVRDVRHYLLMGFVANAGAAVIINRGLAMQRWRLVTVGMALGSAWFIAGWMVLQYFYWVGMQILLSHRGFSSFGTSSRSLDIFCTAMLAAGLFPAAFNGLLLIFGARRWAVLHQGRGHLDPDAPVDSD